MELHIFNGDCACDAWRQSGATGPALVWRENYLEGRIPGPDTGTAEFARIRAGELHAMMPELAEERLLAALNAMDRTLAGLTAGDTAYLWFDACMFDQVMLARILFVLADNPAALYLICEDIVWGDHPELFAKRQSSGRRLDRDDRSLYAAAWRAFAEGADAIRTLVSQPETTRFPFLVKALARHLEDCPGADGPGRSERQLLAVVGAGNRTDLEILRAFNELEEHPFMGDSTCRRLLDELAAKGRLVIRDDGNQNMYFLKSLKE